MWRQTFIVPTARLNNGLRLSGKETPGDLAFTQAQDLFTSITETSQDGPGQNGGADMPSDIKATIEDRDADEVDSNNGTISPLPSGVGVIGRILYAKKAIIALLAAAASLAIGFGWGDEQLWGQITQVVVLGLGVLGVYFATNQDV